MDLTPAQFAALTVRKEEEDRRQDFRIGMIVATMINMIVSGEKGHRVGPLEVMGYEADETAPSAQKEQTSSEMVVRMRLLEAAQKLSGGQK